jgi:hypothetical protein
MSSPTRRSDERSKRGHQTVGEAAVVYPRGGSGVCVAHGGCPGSLLEEPYEEPYDPKEPTVCFDELPYQLVAEKRVPISARPGRAERYDYECTSVEALRTSWRSSSRGEDFAICGGEYSAHEAGFRTFHEVPGG